MQYTRFLNIYLQTQILVIISLICTPLSVAQRARGRPRSCSTVTVPNAEVRFRQNYKRMRIICSQGFILKGSSNIACENGKWNAMIPVCTKEGCEKLDAPPNGFVLPGRYMAHLHCKEGYKLAGGRVTYCNGTHWDRPLGECRETNDAHQMACDFETDDLCDWSHDESHSFDWKRVMAANIFQTLRTGPQHDHTTLVSNAGHYMLMESFDQRPNSVARLLSPIYPKNFTQNSGCFRFYYFMYGATVGSLKVYVRPVSVDIDQMLQESRYLYFNLTGNQESIWNEGLFTIQQMKEDFQIVIEGTVGSNHLSDIAVDDVQLMTYSECNAESTTLMTPSSDYTEYAIFDVQSCEGRCGELNSTGYGIIVIDGKIIKTCDCHLDCENIETCCLNYRTVCDFGDTENSTVVSETIGTIIQSKEDKVFSSITTSLPTQAYIAQITNAAEVTLGQKLNSISSSTAATITTKIKPTITKLTTITPTTIKPTTLQRTTMKFTSTKPITVKPTITKPTTIKPTTIKLTTITPTKTKPTIAKLSPSKSTTVERTTIKPTSIIPTTNKTTKITTTKKATTPTSSSLPTAISTRREETTQRLSDLHATGTIILLDQTSEINVLQRKEEVVSWEVDRTIQKPNGESVWDILAVIVAALTIVVVISIVVKHYGKIRKRFICPYRNPNGDYCETTTLIYNQAEDILMQN